MILPPGQRADEPFDVLTADGEQTGLVKPRAAVHRDGDWHRAFHCWVGWHEREQGAFRILVQRRSAGKDTVPNLLDVAVGGHYRSGESLAQVFREIEEELGISVSLDDLIPLGHRRSVGRADGITDREIQDVFALDWAGDWHRMQPDPLEISALYMLDAGNVGRLFDERSPARSIPAEMAEVAPDRSLGPARQVTVTVADFVPVADGYWQRAAEAVVRALNGGRDIDIGLW